MTTPQSKVSLTDILAVPDRPGDRSIGRILAAVRSHLDMDVAFVTRFRERDRVFTHVDASGASPLKAGDVIALDDGYCRKVVEGQLPQLIADTRLVPATAAIPATQAMPIGAHLSVPIRLGDGRLYGTFCCFGYAANPTLTERDLQFMRAFADLASAEIDRALQAAMLHDARVGAIRQALERGQPDIVFQPILNLADHRIEGFECLSRFDAEPHRSPDAWFREARSVGLGVELELAAVRAALRHHSAFPTDVYLAVNCSPDAVMDDALQVLLDGQDCDRLVIEITEHDSIRDYPAFQLRLDALRARGARIAVDDTGAGYASLRHVLHLDPDKIKLDISLTRGIDGDTKRQALAAALVAFAHRTGGTIVAEGVETEAERRTLTDLGVDCLQGYLIGRPMRVDDALALAGRRVTA